MVSKRTKIFYEKTGCPISHGKKGRIQSQAPRFQRESRHDFHESRFCITNPECLRVRDQSNHPNGWRGDLGCFNKSESAVIPRAGTKIRSSKSAFFLEGFDPNSCDFLSPREYDSNFSEIDFQKAREYILEKGKFQVLPEHSH